MKFANLMAKQAGKAINKAVGNPLSSTAAGTAADGKLGNNYTSHALTGAGVMQSAAKGARAGAAGYGGAVALDAAHQLGSHMSGARTMQDVENDNRQQANQPYAQNVADNLAEPGKAGVQLGSEWQGMAHDMQGAYDAQQRTNRMQTQRKYSRPIGQDYVDNSNQLNSLFKKSLLQ